MAFCGVWGFNLLSLCFKTIFNLDLFVYLFIIVKLPETFSEADAFAEAEGERIDKDIRYLMNTIYKMFLYQEATLRRTLMQVRRREALKPELQFVAVLQVHVDQVYSLNSLLQPKNQLTLSNTSDENQKQRKKSFFYS